MDIEPRWVGLGFLGVAVVLGLLLWVSGVTQVWRGLALLTPRSLSLILVLGFCWLVCWGLTLRQVLDSLDVTISVWRAILLYASAEFTNNITPFGQAGGEPFSGLLISRAADTEYETGLAAIVSVDTINFIPSILFAILGLGYLGASTTTGANVRLLAGFVIGLASGVAMCAYLLWTHRHALTEWTASRLQSVLARLADVSSAVPTLSHADLREAIQEFLDALERVSQKRRNMGAALLFSSVGWLFMCLTLYAALKFITPTSPLPVITVFIIVPVATVAAVLPLPGGEGGVEAALVLLLVPITGIPAAVATSVSLVYRLGTYWLATAFGGSATLYLERTTLTPQDETMSR